MVPPIISLTEIGAPGTIRSYDPQIRSFQPEHWFCDLGQHVAATGLASSPAARQRPKPEPLSELANPTRKAGSGTEGGGLTPPA